MTTAQENDAAEAAEHDETSSLAPAPAAVLENDQPPRGAPSESAGELVEAGELEHQVDAGDAGDAAELEPDTAPAAVIENDQPTRTAPMESAGVLVEDESAPLEREHQVLEPGDVGDVRSVLDNDQPARSAPMESAGVLVEAPAALEQSPSSPPPVVNQSESPDARTIAAPPPAVRVLPRRPRLRATFHYDHEDTINVELTLMDERRNLIYRTTVKPVPGSAIARIFEALVGVAAHAASQAGVFGARQE